MKKFLTIILLSVAVYGFFAIKLGFYWDDWFFAWVYHSGGIKGIVASQSFDRPLGAIFWIAGFLTFNLNPLAWQIGAIFLRIVLALSFFWFLNLYWPKKKNYFLPITLLFAFYPGFSQMPLAIAYFTWQLALIFILLSFSYSHFARQSKSYFEFWFLTFQALIMALFSWFMLEITLPFEFMRLLVIGQKIWQEKITFKEKVLFLIKFELPYFLTSLVYSIWRFGYFKSQRNETNLNFLISDSKNIFDYFFAFLVWIYNFFASLILAWFLPLIIRIYTLETKELLTVLLLSIISFGLYFMVVKKLNFNKLTNKNHDKKWGFNLIIIGSLSSLLLLLPTALANRIIMLTLDTDRYALLISPAIILCLSGIIIYFFSISKQLLIFNILLFLAIAFQFSNSLFYVKSWRQQQQLWSELKTKLPIINPQSTLIIDIHKFNRAISDYELWVPLNILYFPGAKTPQIFAASINSPIWQQFDEQNNLYLKQRNVELMASLVNPLLTNTDPDGKLQISQLDKIEFLASNNNPLCQKSNIKLQEFFLKPNLEEITIVLEVFLAKLQLYLTSSICPSF